MEYLTPTSIQEAVDLLGRYGDRAKVLAGGTDLIVQLRDRAVEPEVLLDVGRLPELRGIARGSGRIRLGPATPYEQVCSDPITREHAPLLVEAVETIGCPQIRAKGTVGGNVMNASPVADAVPPLVALNARIRTLSSRGERWRPVEGISLGPGRTELEPDELLTMIELDAQEPGELGFFRKLGQRKALIIAKVSVTFRARREDRRLRDVRVVLGAVAPRVIRASETEALLEGRLLDEAVALEAAHLAASEATPISDHRSTAAYRTDMVFALLYRGLTEGS